MQWSDIPFNPSRKVLRQFAALGLVCFLALGAREVFFSNQLMLGLALGFVAVLVGLTGLVRPALLRRIFVAWMVVVFPIGWLISQLILVMLYFLVLTPVAWILRLRGRDLLGRTPTPGRESYWEPKQLPLDPRSYFRQY
ncbi:MAG: SxtJ family membrane protein [Verrucomicrobia bacterium]|nr:SxtJ family membrane protein [Verrucomicrobiota bacterium]